jgi:hypothetical protein
MAVLSRLYGFLGPTIVTGLPPGTRLRDCMTKTAVGEQGVPNATTGLLETSDGLYTFTLRWRLVAGSPLLGEVLPYREVLGEALPSKTKLRADVARRVYHDVPLPRLELGAVESKLWEVTLPAFGLPLAIRCLACWWRHENDTELERDAAVLAASLTGVVARRSGIQSNNRDVSLMHNCDPAETTEVARVLNTLLARDAVRWF